jgi:hypothetical protein
MYRYNEEQEAQLMWTEWILVAIPLLVYALILVAGLRRPTEHEVDRWIDVYSCPADETTRAIVRRYLTRTRRTRFCFALAGFLGGHVGSLTDTFSWANAWVLLVAGYLVGSIVAEMAFGRAPRPSGTITAALSRRVVASYLPRVVIVALIAVPIATVVAAIWQVGLAAEAPRRFGNLDPDAVKGAAATGVVLAIAAGVALSTLVRRPQPAASAQAIATDDAFRSSSMHAIAGSTLTLSCSLFATVLAQLSAALAAHGSRFAFAASVGSLLAVVGALVSWLVVRHPSRWTSQRSLVSAPSGTSR